MSSLNLDALYLDHIANLERRYAGVLAREGWDAVVIHSGSPIKRSQFDDQFWPLRPSPHFAHWLPLVEPECAVVFRPERRPKLVRTSAPTFWETPPEPESRAFLEALDVIEVRESAAIAEQVGTGRVAFVGEDPRMAAAWGIAPERVCPPSMVKAFDALRATKTPYEVACIAEANRRARAGHVALRSAFGAGDASELDLHLLFLGATAQDDWETPYKNIVALGSHAATLHHVAYGRHGRHEGERGGESLLVDAGATCRGYASDITRTWTKGTGAAANTFAQLVAGVEAMQQRLCEAVRVGVPYEELHDESHRQLATVFREVGLVRGVSDEAIAGVVTRAFYPHGLGHSLGLQTHDVGCGVRMPRAENPFLRNTSDVAEGQVFTIEPGVYFIESLLAELRAKPEGRAVDWHLVETLAPLGGVRIEDDVYVGDAGPRNLTREQLPLGGGIVD